MSLENESAFPQSSESYDWGYGLSKLEYLSTKICAGLVSGLASSEKSFEYDEISRAAVLQARSLLKELEGQE